MGLIKAREAPTSAAAFSMKDVEAYAASLLGKARRQAEELLAETEMEAERIRQERFETGYREGRAAGLAKGMEEGRQQGHAAALAAQAAKIEGLVTALTGAAVQLEASRRKLESETVFDVIRLAVAIARRVTKQLGSVSPEVAKANVAEALKMVVNASAVTVALHPTQLRVMEEDLPAIRAMFPRLQQVELVGDATLAPGGCRLIAGTGMVDADLDTQLDRIVADLLPPGTEHPVPVSPPMGLRSEIPQ